MVSNFDFSAIMDDRYDFSHIKRGYMAIIVNDSFKNGRKRKGSDVDMINLMGVANKLGLSPVTKKNVTKTQMMQFLLDLQMLDFSECDTFAFAISTHGVETPNPRKGGALDHALVCTDDELIYTSTITEMFSNGNCPSLCNKPKMFFIEASKKNIEEETVSLHCEIDQLVFYASPPGTSALRNEAEGSCMISDLHSLICRQDTSRPFDMLKMLTKVIAKTCQRSSQSRPDLALGDKKAVPVIKHKMTRDLVMEPKSALLLDYEKEE
ncbi:caspase-1-like [Dreissena polymorpha]|uniref:caspase-1-like n=1 Tax=Dreissena polymorpha TaxID=45954 RepID=UPI002264D7C6|nr:caspase-1-like [Dreissena polymorpha]